MMFLPNYVPVKHLCPGFERKDCLITASYLPGLFDIFVLFHICQNCVCFGDFLPVRTFCDTYREEFESD